MKQLIMMVGPAGCGKSTIAKEYEEKFGYVRVSQDEQGKDGHMEKFLNALENGEDVIIDRMNFNVDQRKRYLEPAKVHGYTTQIIVKHQSWETCFNRIMARTGHPTITDEKGARGALKTFFTLYERVEDHEADSVVRLYRELEDLNKPSQKVVICDLDGTLFNINHRLHFLKGEGKKDWKGFFSEINNDSVNEWCKDTVLGLESRGLKIVFCSGRADDYQKETVQSLKKAGFSNYPLFMRHRADFRQDYIIKEIILDFELLTRGFIPVLCIDDRQQIVDLWRKRGYVCLQCEKGDF